MLPTQHLIKDFHHFLLKKGKFSHTCESYCRDAKNFLDFCSKNNLELTQCEPSTLIHFQQHLKELGHKPNSIRRAVIAVRQLFRFFQLNGNIISTPFDEVVIPARIEIAPKQLDGKKINEIFSACFHSHHSLKSYRDSALVALLAYEGMKVTEIISLRWADYLRYHDFSSLKISGSKARLIQISHDSHRLLAIYHQACVEFNLLDGSKNSSMFVSFRGRDFSKIVPKISRHGLKFMLYEIGQNVGLPNLNAELLRHHAMSYLLQLGKTQEEIMYHLGLRRVGNIAKHTANPNTTELARTHDK